MMKTVIQLSLLIMLSLPLLHASANDSNAKTIAVDQMATLRKAPINVEPTPPNMPKVINLDIKEMRNYPMQPPVIPHKIDHYQVNLNVNKCMSCHARKRTRMSQAPMVSVTHFKSWDGNFLAELSPTRYFCSQCHVVQTDAKLLVPNNFVDMDSLVKEEDKDIDTQSSK